MYYLYHQNRNGVCIDRCFGYDGILELPEKINDFPVTELGAYMMEKKL